MSHRQTDLVSMLGMYMYVYMWANTVEHYRKSWHQSLHKLISIHLAHKSNLLCTGARTVETTKPYICEYREIQYLSIKVYVQQLSDDHMTVVRVFQPNGVLAPFQFHSVSILSFSVPFYSILLM